MSATVGKRDSLGLELRESRFGAWHATAEIDSDVPLSGIVEVNVEGVTWSAFVLRSPSIGGRARVELVGGKGGFSKKLPARHYVATTADTVFADILREAGEVMAKGLGLTKYRLAHWERLAGRASHCMLALCDKLGLSWRVNRDGTVWIGAETWPKVAPEVAVEDEGWNTSSVQVFGETFTENAKLKPGTTWEGHQLEEVAHIVTPDAIRTVCKVDSMSAAMSRFLEVIRGQIAMAASYECEVISQNADGTLQLKPMDERLAKRGNGLDRVRIAHGLPGFTVKVSAGAKVRVQFHGANYDEPYAAIWSEGANGVTSVEFTPHGVGAPACRVGDTVDAALPMGVPVTGLLGGVPFAGVITVTAPVKAVIVGPGNPSLLI